MAGPSSTSPVSPPVDPFTAPSPVTPADVLSLLEAYPSTGLLARPTPLPRSQGWRLEISEDDGQTWTSFEAGKPGHSTILESVQTGHSDIKTWRESRNQANNSEIGLLVTQGKLEKRTIKVDDGTGLKDSDGYAVKLDNGEWVESVNAVDAVNKSRKRNQEIAAEKGKSIQSAGRVTP